MGCEIDPIALTRRNKLEICSGEYFFPRAIQDSTHTSFSQLNWYKIRQVLQERGKLPSGHHTFIWEMLVPAI